MNEAFNLAVDQLVEAQRRETLLEQVTKTERWAMRTQNDTGATINVIGVHNALRVDAGLPRISVSDLTCACEYTRGQQHERPFPIMPRVRPCECRRLGLHGTGFRQGGADAVMCDDELMARHGMRPRPRYLALLRQQAAEASGLKERHRHERDALDLRHLRQSRTSDPV